MTISERIKKVRTSLGMSQEKFGAQLGTSRDAINNAENGRAEIKETLIKLICKEFNVEYEWIKTGNGSMFHQSSDDDIPAMVDFFAWREYNENQSGTNVLNCADF